MSLSPPVVHGIWQVGWDLWLRSMEWCMEYGGLNIFPTCKGPCKPVGKQHFRIKENPQNHGKLQIPARWNICILFNEFWLASWKISYVRATCGLVQSLHHLKLEENIFYRRVGCTFGVELHASLCPDPAMLCQIHGTLTTLAQLAQDLAGISQALSWKHVSIQHNRLALLEKHCSEQASLSSEVLNNDPFGQPWSREAVITLQKARPVQTMTHLWSRSAQVTLYLGLIQ